MNWATGQPVPGVTVCWLGLHGPNSLVETDRQGRFTAVVAPRELYFLVADDSRFGPLLQNTIGQLVAVYSRGEQHTDVVIPAMPSTELSGHVYSEGGTPIRGCQITALTSDGKRPGSLATVGYKDTNADGAYTFTNLGADRYFLQAQCRHYLPGEPQGIDVGPAQWRVRKSPPPLLWPQASSLKQAKAITLFPGDVKREIDFHMRAVDQYSIFGEVVLSDGSAFRHDRFSTDNMQIAPVGIMCNHSSPDCQACRWGDIEGHFRCDFVAPGLYGIHLHLEGNPPYDEASKEYISQEADVPFEVRAGDQKQNSLTVRLREKRSKVVIPPSHPETGLLEIHRICPPGMPGGWSIAVMARGATSQYLRSGSSSCSDQEVWPLPVGEYRVFAFEWNLSGGRIDKLSPLLEQQATRVIIARNRTTSISLQVASKEQVLELVMAYLRALHEP